MHSFYRPHKRLQFDNELVNPHTGEVTHPPSMTKQEFKAECDINNIIKQFSATGMMRHVSAKAAMGMYTDLPYSIDFQESLALVQDARDRFMTLPAKVRDRFHQDPAEFLDFMSDPDNKQEALDLGLLNPPQIPTSYPVEVGGAGGTPPAEDASKAS